MLGCTVVPFKARMGGQMMYSFQAHFNFAKQSQAGQLHESLQGMIEQLRDSVLEFRQPSLSIKVLRTVQAVNAEGLEPAILHDDEFSRVETALREIVGDKEGGENEAKQ